MAATAGSWSGSGPTRTVEPVGGLGTVLVVLLTIMAIGSIVFAVAFVDRARVLGDPASTGSDIADAFRRVDRTGKLYILGVVVTGVVWIRWQVHFVRNVQALARSTGFEPGWAIGGWLIPGANFAIPQHQLAVSAKSSDPGDSPSTPGVLYAWWAVSVVAGVLLFVGSGGGIRPQGDEFSRATHGDFQVADQVHALCFSAAFVAAVLGIATVFACTNRQEQLLAHRH